MVRKSEKIISVETFEMLIFSREIRQQILRGGMLSHQTRDYGHGWSSLRIYRKSALPYLDILPFLAATSSSKMTLPCGMHCGMRCSMRCGMRCSMLI